ncbi:MAG TPA: acyl-CoA dehydrogenase family protein [Actinophytocola sp.]|uniref:acyl-CoA dehydrogenase family protein n=1 Tax=Actinophytocola sp. TaxID=1872138 RepID=UPI002DDD2DD4|nr:acyl-CoA dehydrogenase family protein [Actinophytocola sp.]HEV2778327.1 acyl-CoA dehydrogenase family protein [Actinophytocola sp.]
MSTPAQVGRAAAEELAATLRVDAAERDRAARPPVKEVGLLRGSGLLTLLIPVELGGGGGAWPDANTVTRIVAGADASVGHLIGYHYLHQWRSELFDRREITERLRRQTVRHSWFWAGVSNPLDADLTLTPAGDGFTVDGRKTFATGAMVADRLVVSAVRADSGEKVTFTVDAGARGIGYLDDWDNMGQRLTASGGVVFDNVAVPAGDVLGVQPDDPLAPGAVRISLAALGFQLILCQIYVGIAEGALAEAAEYTRRRTRPWTLSGVDSAVADPYILAGYGELVAGVRAARLLADEAAAALHAAAERGSELTAEERGAAAVTISAAKVLSTRVVTETTSRIFEFAGARATAAAFGFDRFWRNARTLTLHDPVAYKAREVGAHFLTGEYPPFTGYS